jgi:hypothetical protein
MMKTDKIKLAPVLLLAAFFLLSPFFASSNEQLSLSITPPLFQVNLEPGSKWASTIRVINSNSYEITVYPHIFGFQPQGEVGHSSFIPINGSIDLSYTLPGWLEINEGPVTIPGGTSGQVPFFINVPDDASPGGHYAAVMIGTRPPATEGGGSQVRVSSMVSSLFFVRIAGEVEERGDIRDFSPTQKIYQTPEASFVLRFENKGNVHIQPQGDIVIYNMWGKERGIIPINHKTRFGNVMPESIRRFTFDWKGENSLLESGRYKAIATLTYGESGRKTVHYTTYFWVIPLVPVASILGGILLFIFFLAFSIRAYIRKALQLASPEFGMAYFVPAEPRPAVKYAQVAKKTERNKPVISMKVLARPVTEGVIDLRKAVEHTTQGKERALADERTDFTSFIVKYRFFFGFLAVLVVGVASTMIYFSQVLLSERSFDVFIQEGDGEIVLSSEEVIKDRLLEMHLMEQTEDVDGAEELEETLTAEEKNNLTVTVLNASGVAGLAAETAVALERRGIMVERLGTTERSRDGKNMVKYSEFKEKEAVYIAELLDAQMERMSEGEPETDVVVIIGDGS